MDVIKKSTTKKYLYLIFIIFGFFTISTIFAANHVVNLTIAYKTVNFTGKNVKAIAVNGQIPGPTLHFKEGDHVTINVFNHLNHGTSIHWHGVLVPWQMDGVENVTQQPIPPSGVFHYHFTLMQAGTYWYHAHAHVQEQDGLYGAFLIDPPKPTRYHYNKDYVIVLSDWNNIKGDKTLADLKKDGDYFSPKFPLQPSLMKFIHDYRKADSLERKKLIMDYKMMQQMRMSIYDISDVAYDAYLLNGHTKNNPWTAPVKVGDVVRLRFIGAAGSTIYRVKMPGTIMEVVNVQGNDVKPYTVSNFSIAPGETLDVLVKIQKNSPYIIYAESIDTLGKAYGALITQPEQPINYQVKPFPEPKPVTRDMMSNMMMSSNPASMNMIMNKGNSQKTKAHSSSMKMDSGMKMNSNMPIHHSMQNMHKNSHNMHSMPKKKMNSAMKMSNDKKTMDHSSMSMEKMSDSNAMNMKMDHPMNMGMPTEPTIIGDHIIFPTKDLLEIKTSGTKYQDLIAAVKTNNPNKPIDGIIRMELFGYMDRFTWFINGLPEYKAHPIVIEAGKRYRIIFTNNSMMRHPMHIHLHWFILRNGHGAFDPLLHTIEVPPGATVAADVDADASGQAFFHCHHLYHMMTGMSRVFQYQSIIDIVKGTRKPENIKLQQSFVNRPIIRVDESMPIDPALVNHPMAHHPGFYLANFLDVGEDPFNKVQKLTFKGLYGRDCNKLELYTNDAEMKKGKIENVDVDIFYWHLISQFWAIKGGANYFYQSTGTPYWQPGIGIEGLMPYFIDTNFRTYYHSGSIKFDLELSRDTQITNNFFIRLGIRSILATQTVFQDRIGSGLNQMRYIVRPYYRLAPGFNIFSEYEHEQDYGAFKNMQNNTGESTNENTVTIGLAVLF